MTVARNSRIQEVETLHSLGGALFVQEQTKAFAEKRQFRAYRRGTANLTIKMVFTKPFYLTYQRLWTGTGACALTITTGGTEAGSFVADPLIFKSCKWLVDGPVLGATTVSSGGTTTGGSEREVLESDSGTGGNANGNGDSLPSKRALPAGTYYFSAVVSGTTRWTYVLEWEEFA